MIILHYTGMETGDAALARLCDPVAEVSAHYVVEQDGRIYQLVADDKRAWHAGKSYWSGIEDINSASIGIEIVNKGHEFGYETFFESQISALEGVLQALVDRYGIRSDCILGHSDIAPERKSDPGELFPWCDLAARGLGVWPDVLEMDRDAAAELFMREQAVHDLLVEYGYGPDARYEALVVAFHRHFYPEKFLPGADPALVSAETLARLLALIRQKNALENENRENENQAGL